MSDITLSFDPLTIEHLGFKMYSHLPNAIAELVANAYDADASTVVVTVDPETCLKVCVEDDGHGMDDDDINNRYLRIGRNRRSEAGQLSESGERRVAGRKGLGKLALFGIGDIICVRTKRAGTDRWTRLVLDWEEIHDSAGGEYVPAVSYEEGEPEEHGTSVTIERLRRKSPIDRTPFVGPPQVRVTGLV